ncbi:MAG: adenylate/guanylate cyclase domain-containing protein [Leptospirales bacterium]
MTAQESGNESIENRSPKFPIRVKLQSIISLIVVASLTATTMFALNYFETDTENKVFAEKTATAKLLAERIQISLDSQINEVDLMYSTKKDFRAGKAALVSRFFSDEKEVFYTSLVEKTSSGSTRKVDDMYDSVFFKDSDINISDVLSVHEHLEEDLVASFNGITLVKNLSALFQTPVMAIVTPVPDAGKKSQVYVILIQMNSIMAIFGEKSDSTRTHLIDASGNLIASNDRGIILDEGNLAERSEVKSILSQTANAGTLMYQNDTDEWFYGAFNRIPTGNLMVIAEVSQYQALEAIREIRYASIFITLIVLVLAFTVIYFFAKSLSVPLKRLVQTSNEIQKGNYHHELTSTSRDEVGHLTEAFNLMSTGLEEREKLKGALNKFVNPEIAEQAMRGEIKLGGERAQATIFFSDIRSFTNISETLEPEEVVEFLNEYMTVMLECITKTHGVVDKFIGDAIMAVWGTPVSRGNDEENAINGTLMMRLALIKFNVGRGAPKKPIIKIGSGINSGPVIAGQIGSNDRLEYTVIGDAVNLASRIEALNKPFGTDILISQETFSRVENLFDCVAMQKIKVKGKSDPQQIYAVLGNKGDPDAPKNIEEMRAMVGIDFKGPANPVADEGEVKYEILDDPK